jgi:hypothetical protein
MLEHLLEVPDKEDRRDEQFLNYPIRQLGRSIKYVPKSGEGEVGLLNSPFSPQGHLYTGQSRETPRRTVMLSIVCPLDHDA